MSGAKRGFTWLAVALLGLPAPAGTSSIQSRERTFKVKSNAVPVDVVVIDKDRRPVLGLTVADFEIFEDGVLQKIVYFSAPAPSVKESMPNTPNRASVGTDIPAAEPTAGDRRQSARRRILLLLGNIGDDYFESIESLAEFVLKLKPSDEVALMAFRRVGEFTGDHAKTAAAIRRYIRVNDSIDAILSLRRKSHLLLVSSPHAKRLPDSIRRRMKAFFEESGLRSRELPEPVFQDVQLDPLTRPIFDEMRHMDSLNALAAARISGSESNRAGAVDLFLDTDAFTVNQFDEARRKLLADFPDGEGPVWTDISELDLSQLLTAIEYLSLLDGEKEIFFLNDRGLHATSAQIQQISRFAATNRVRIFLFQTGGTLPAVDFGPRRNELFHRPGSLSGTDTVGNVALNQGLSPNLALSALEILARETGGSASIHRRISESLETALATANATYELAYSTSEDGRAKEFRTIEVRLKEKDLRALHRGGYSGVPSFAEEDRRRSLTLLRTVAAMKQADYFNEIPVSMQVSKRPDTAKGSLYEVRLVARMTEKSFRQSEGVARSELAVAYFLVQGKQVLSYQDTVSLNLDRQDYQDALKDGFNFVRFLEIPKGLKDTILKIVVYEPANDLIGSADTALPTS